MKQEEFERQITRLRNHFGERHYSNEIVAIFWDDFKNSADGAFRKVVSEAIATHGQGRAPIRDDFRRIARELNYSTNSGSSWKHFEVSDCLRCGGGGWHYVHRPQGGEAVVACDDCRAGKNLQVAPKGIISWTIAMCPPGTTYSRPGAGSSQVQDV